MSIHLEKEPQAPALQGYDLTVADAVWIATAMLHKEHPDYDLGGFTTEYIVQKVQMELLTKARPKTIYQHVNQHCVANRDPMPNRSCMLFALGRGNRRLYIEGVDKRVPGREGAPSKPEYENLPPELQHWLKWYAEWRSRQRPSLEVEDPLLALVGSGKDIWADEDADKYINRLREGWE